MALEEINNHGDLAVGLLLEQLKDKEKLEAFLRALVGPAQELEEVAHDLDTEMRLDNAVGAQLDMIGRIVNLQRGSLSDNDYRTRLRAHIRANRSEGTPDDLLEVLRLMVEGNSLSIEEYPTGIVMRIADTLSEDPDAIVSELARARPSAVPLHLEYTLADGVDTFRFASGDTEEVDESAGFGGYRWIAIGDDAGTETYITTSDGDQTAWTQRTNPEDEDLNGMASDGNGTVIAVGNDDGSDPYAIRSTDDGETWAEIDLPDSVVDLNAVCYSPELDLWVAAGDDAGSQSLVLTSDDGGESWITRTIPGDINLYCVCWCPSLGLFLIGGDTVVGTDYLSSSPDGVAWTTRARPGDGVMRGICWSETLGLAVAVGYSDGVDGYIVTSPNGINWTERANPANLDLYGVCWCEGLGLFVAVGDYDGGGCYIVTSPDGITWTRRSSGVGGGVLRAVATRGEAELVAVGDAAGGDAIILTSPDGITWTEQTNPANYALFAVAGIQRSIGGAWAAVKEA
jgi:photosystem II stability/assembly factor-like uncharacterized protein